MYLVHLSKLHLSIKIFKFYKYHFLKGLQYSYYKVLSEIFVLEATILFYYAKKEVHKNIIFLHKIIDEK